MRFLPLMFSLATVVVFSGPASAKHFDDVEDAAEDYRKAVGKMHKELKKEKYAPPYFAQMTHRLERAADRLEDLADDERDVYLIHSAFEEVAVLHARFTELTHSSHAFGGRHAARRLEDVHRRFAELSRAMDYLGHPGAFERRPGHHRSNYLGYPSLHSFTPPAPRREPHRVELQFQISPRDAAKRHAHQHHGRKLEKDLRKGRSERLLPRLFPHL